MDKDKQRKIKRMQSLLIELSETEFWKAIQWHSNIAQLNTDNYIRVADPTKEPTKIAREQGCWWGVKALERYIAELKEEAKKQEEQPKEDNK